jgi:ribosome-associated protein
MGDDLFSDADSGEDELKSKTQIKKELLALVDLGEELVKLGKSALQKMPLDSELRDAVDTARDMHRKKSSYKRQLQFIGKLLRSRDTAPIEDALENLKGQQLQARAHFHMLEQLRDKLVQDGDKALQDLLEEHSHLDRQRLRQWIRQAQKEREANKPPKAYREIFQYLKDELKE